MFDSSVDFQIALETFAAFALITGLTTRMVRNGVRANERMDEHISLLVSRLLDSEHKRYVMRDCERSRRPIRAG